MTTAIIITVAAVFLAVFIWSNWRAHRAQKSRPLWGQGNDGSATIDGKRPQVTTFTDKNNKL